MTTMQVTPVVDRHSWKREEGLGGGVLLLKLIQCINRKMKILGPDKPILFSDAPFLDQILNNRATIFI